MVGPRRIPRTVHSQKGKAGLGAKNTRLKRHTFHMTRRQVLLIILMLFLLTGSSMGYVWSNFESTQIGYSLSQLKREEIRLKEAREKLRLELAYLRAPQRLQDFAFQALGLRQPSSEQIIVLP